jgi:hypothetical protein
VTTHQTDTPDILILSKNADLIGLSHRRVFVPST